MRRNRYALAVITGLLAASCALAMTGCDSPAVVVIAPLAACHLGPKGKAAVATTISVKALDAACTTFLDHELATLPAYVDAAIIACNPTPDPRACYDARLKAREGAIKACRVYGEARGSEAAATAARLALDAIR